MKIDHKGSSASFAENEPTLEEVSGLVGDTLLEFGTPWCGHCQLALPAIKQVLTEHSGLLHIKVYDGKGKPLGRAFRVKLWPTLILLREGKEIGRLVRPSSVEQVRQFVMQFQ